MKEKERGEHTSAKDAALRLLTHSARTSGELKRRLKEKGYGEEEVDETIALLTEAGLLNDRTYAESFAEECVRKLKGPFYTRGKLHEKEIPSDVISDVMEEFYDRKTEDEICRERADKLLYADENDCSCLTDRKTYEKYMRKLVTAGFNTSTAGKALQKIRDDHADRE